MLLHSSAETQKNKTPLFKKNKKWIVLSFIFFVAIIVFLGNNYASKAIQANGYTNLWDFVKTVTLNYWNGISANPEKVSIEIKEKDYKFLETNRERALERNLIINNIDGGFVPATLESQGKKIKINLRLKGHMTDHLQNNKWSFRIKVKDKDSYYGMKRFSFQHPGTRGYIYEWIYHELMKREEIISLRYKFINLFVNGRDWGIYAVEENFEKDLIENNSRKLGPIVRFNPDLYWINRYNMMLKQSSPDEFSSYYSGNIESYRENDILADSTQRKYFLSAMALIEGLRSKKLSIDEVFDVKRLAKFHAIVDLVGGLHSLDWSDIKYYYNPITEKLEPVAYESFTDFNVSEISGTYRYVQIDSAKQNFDDWHTALFSNSTFFKEYVKELERVSNPSYLDNFFNLVKDDLNKNLKILNKEFPYKKFDKKDYYTNQNNIKRILSTPKGFHAYFYDCSNELVHIQIGGIESLPIEIKAINIKGNVSKPLHEIILPAKQNNQYVNYKTYDFKLPNDIVWNDSLIKSIKIIYSVLGSSIQREVIVFPYPHTESEFISLSIESKKSTIAKFPFLEIDEKTKSIRVKAGRHIINSDLVIPPDYIVFANVGVSIDIVNKAKIVSYSPLIFEGNEDEQIKIESTDSTSQGIKIISAEHSKFNYVLFNNLPKVIDSQWQRSGAITLYESSVEFKDCSFFNSNAKEAVSLIRSKFSFKECLFNKMNSDGIRIDFSNGSLTNCAFENCDKNAIDFTLSKVNLNMIVIENINKAINAKDGSQINGSNIKIKNANIAVSSEDLSLINLKNVTISNSKIGVVAFKNKSGGGEPTVNIGNLTLVNVKKNCLKEKESTVIINGKTIVDGVYNIDTIIKDDKKKQ